MAVIHKTLNPTPFGILHFAVALFVIGALFRGASAKEDSFTVTIDQVQYTLPSDEHNFQFPNRTASNPYNYVYKYMYIVITDRKLSINGNCQYRAQSGDRVEVTYAPYQIFVNGKKIASDPSESVTDRGCP